MPSLGSGKDLTGARYGHLTIVSEAPKASTSRERRWNCLCDCGQHVIAWMNNLEKGRTRSCGCSLKGLAIGDKRSTHGHTRRRDVTPEYTAWGSMWTRCTNPKARGFEHYGGRGIKVHPDWKSFERFLSDMGERPSSGHSIERRNVDANYSAANCYWGTAKEQCLNKRNTLRLSFQGETKSAVEWSEITGIPYHTLCFRIRSGWTPERSLTEPVKSPIKTGPAFITFNNETKTISEWAAITGLKRSTIGMRLQKGWPPERALAPGTRASRDTLPIGP